MLLFCSEAVNTSGGAVRGLVKSRVEFPPAQIRGVFVSFPQKRNGIVLSEGVNYLHSDLQ